MKKYFIIIVLLVLIILYSISSSGAIMREIVSYRNDLDSPLGADKYKYGDLYGFSYLQEYRLLLGSDSPSVKLDRYNVPKIIDLYVVHDSYLNPPYIESNSITSEISNYYEFADESNLISLDTTKKNILVIEIVERNIRKYAQRNNNFHTHKASNEDLMIGAYLALKRFYRIVFNPNFDQNFHYNVFEYHFLTPLKELRADINYMLFEQIDPMVVISSDRKYLYLAETIDTSKNTSSFNPIKDKEIDEIIKTLNAKYDYYKSIGFREIYFSIIPNPVTILNTEKYKYNELIPKIQNHKNLNMPMIDIYSVFKRRNKDVQIYQSSDSHWTIDGFRLWVNELNNKLAVIATAKEEKEIKQGFPN